MSSFFLCTRVFSHLARAKQVVETLLEPDERGWVDRRSLFRLVKCTLPSAPDRALEGVLDDFMKTLQMDSMSSSTEKGSYRYRGRNNSGNNGHNENQVLIRTILNRGDFIDRLTLHGM